MKASGKCVKGKIVGQSQKSPYNVLVIPRPVFFGTHLSTRVGFTLIELLLVIGIIAILASMVIIAINPTRQLNAARDTQRRSDVQSILNAVYQWSIDNNTMVTTIPDNVSSTATDNTWSQKICKSTYSPASVRECTSLRMLSGTYLVSIPYDPSLTSGTGYSGYKIWKDLSGRVTVAASGSLVISILTTR